MRRRPAVLLAPLALAAVLAGCGSSGSSSTRSAGAATTTSGGPSLKVDTAPQYTAPSQSSPVLSGRVRIAYRDISIHPDVVRVRVGSTITWTNYDPVVHNVTGVSGSPHLSSGSLSEGESYTILANRPGTIHYLCTIHPTSMNGTIEVVPQGAG
jgi:plastocyanin